MSWRRDRGQRGDTIIEVMIALAILGLTIGVAYATANKSLQATRSAQEASQAMQILQNQSEAIRVLMDQRFSDDLVISNRGDFCIHQEDPNTPIRTNVVNDCQFEPNAANYHLRIRYCSAPLTAADVTAGCPPEAVGRFWLRITWDDPIGSDRAQATLIYRAYKVWNET